MLPTEWGPTDPCGAAAPGPGNGARVLWGVELRRPFFNFH